MKFIRADIVGAPTLLAVAYLCFSDVVSSAGLDTALAGASGVRPMRNDGFEVNYPGTECVDLFVGKLALKVGLVCRSRSREFIRDMGITEFEALPESERPKVRPISGLIVSTPMSQYAMTMAPRSDGEVASARVDCDTDNGPIYRATGTCQIGVTKPLEGTVIYTNFIVKRHTRAGPVLSQTQAREIWRRLQTP